MMKVCVTNTCSQKKLITSEFQLQIQSSRYDVIVYLIHYVINNFSIFRADSCLRIPSEPVLNKDRLHAKKLHAIILLYHLETHDPG